MRPKSITLIILITLLILSAFAQDKVYEQSKVKKILVNHGSRKKLSIVSSKGSIQLIRGEKKVFVNAVFASTGSSKEMVQESLEAASIKVDQDKNTIYIWVGLEVPQAKKDIIADIARKIDKERGGSAKILIMKQKREYGSFLAMMHDLERGLIPGKSIERRPEFVFEAPPKTIEPVDLDSV